MNKPIFTHNGYSVYRDIFGVWTATNLTTGQSTMSSSLDNVFMRMDGDKVFEPLPDEVREFIDSPEHKGDVTDVDAILEKHGYAIDINQTNGIPMGLKKASEPEPILWARKCSVTGEGMNKGWVADNGDAYFKFESDAKAWAILNEYNDLEDAYENEAIYYTEWVDESDYDYQEIDGVLVTIE